MSTTTGTSANCSCHPSTVILDELTQLSQYECVRGCFYLLWMLYIFLGIALVADIFMNGVERITNRRKVLRRFNAEKQQFEVVSVRVWNQTVANLTLMAFGSSSPEILLATIEVFKDRFEADELGPGTVVGASAFNSFVITAFCVVSLPATQVKAIRKVKVFWTTTAFSLAAYAWLYLMLNVLSPNVVTVWEAAVTLLFFPAMVTCGYLAEKNLFLGERPDDEEAGTVVVTEEEDNNLIMAEENKWSAQIVEAFKVDDEQCKSCWNLCSHFFTFFWKVIFSVSIPPVHLLGGWPTLLCSILWIGLLTGLMGDLAASFGCALHWDLHTTSITVVAVGTSLPDLFASRVAAKREPTADDAIGNINGSNAFNVFLGLGFPWFWASVYHQSQGTTFQVSQLDDLSFSVRLFILFSALQLLLMTGRRFGGGCGGGELGGPRLFAWLTFGALIALWLLYIGLSIVR